MLSLVSSRRRPGRELPWRGHFSAGGEGQEGISSSQSEPRRQPGGKWSGGEKEPEGR